MQQANIRPMIVLHLSRGNEKGPQLKDEGEASVHETTEGSHDIPSDQDGVDCELYTEEASGMEAEDF